MVEKMSSWAMSTWTVSNDELARVQELLKTASALSPIESLMPEQAVNQPFDSFFTCSICLSVVPPDMVECGQCDKLNCKSCIADWTHKQNNCPNCRAEFTPSGKPNRFVMNMLNEMTFNCNHCSGSFKYADHQKHVKACK
jgi:hypothetical protein